MALRIRCGVCWTESQLARRGVVRSNVESEVKPQPGWAWPRDPRRRPGLPRVKLVKTSAEIKRQKHARFRGTEDQCEGGVSRRKGGRCVGGGVSRRNG